MRDRKIVILGTALLALSFLLHLPARSQPDDRTPWASYIAYSAEHWTGEQEIEMVNTATGQQHLLTLSTEDSIKPFWSPDGTQIAFTRYGQVALLENAGTSIDPRVVDGAFADTNIAWKPDGSGFATNTGLVNLVSGESQEW